MYKVKYITAIKTFKAAPNKLFHLKNV